MFAEATHIVLR